LIALPARGPRGCDLLVVACLLAALAITGCKVEARDETKAGGLPSFKVKLPRGWNEPSKAEAQLGETIARLRIQGQEGAKPDFFTYELLGFHKAGGVPEAASVDALVQPLRNDPSLPEFARVIQGSLRENGEVVEEFTRLERTVVAGEPAVYYDYIEDDADRRIGHRVIQTIHGKAGLTLNLSSPADQLDRFSRDLEKMTESWKWKDPPRED